MRGVLILVSALALSVALGPAALDAQEQSSAATTGQSPEGLIEQYYRQLFARRYDQALAAANALPSNPANPELSALVGAMRAGALLGLKKDAEAQGLIADVNKLSPKEPYAFTTLFESGIISERYDVAATAFDVLMARFPDVARTQDPDFVRYLLRNAPKDQERSNDDRRIALARIGYGGESPRADWYAFTAIALLLERGDAAAAADLVRYVDEVEAIETMLINRRYSALWPKLEESAGAHLANVRASSVASAEREFQKSPDDHERLQILADAYRNAGRLDDAIRLRSRLPSNLEAMSKADEDLGWAVNNVALAFHEAGRFDEGDELFAMLNDAAMPDERGRWRVSMIINRIEALVDAGKFEKAAALLDAAERSARNDGNPYAQQLVRRLNYCTLSSLGRKDEAAKVLPAMLEHAVEAVRPTIEGLLCAGEIDQAEQLALKMLNDPKIDKDKKEQLEEELVRGLQPVSLTNSDPSVWEKSWKGLRARPAIAAAYARLGRDMPERFLPVRTSLAGAK